MKNAATLALFVTAAAFSFWGASRAAEPSLREQLMAIPVTAQLGGATTRPLETPDAFSFQAPNAERKHQRPFSFGNRLFNTNWVQAPASVQSFDGLGPLFNRVSCAGCHTRDGRGQPPEKGEGPMEQMLFRLSLPGEGPHGGPRPVPGYGEQLSERAIGTLPAEGRARISYETVQGHFPDGEIFTLRKPTLRILDQAYGALPDDTLLSARVAPQMIGLGLLEAVPEQTLKELADPDDTDKDGVSGRLNTVWNTAVNKPAIGRFGWKAGQPDLLNQNAAAALGDIGLTSSLRPVENCSEGQNLCQQSPNGGAPELTDAFLDKLTLYTASLAVPAQRGADDTEVKQGALIFRQLGCAACHLPTLQTQEAALPELRNQTFHPYTDLLLHDMGPGLSDNRPEFEATGLEWRTPPLWGLGLVPVVNGHSTLLHDGRARNFSEAILWHGGEAEQARNNFISAPKANREALVRFLNSL